MFPKWQWLMSPKSRWFLWNFAAPVFGPIVLSGLFVILWMPLKKNFTPDFGIIVDVTPWAITFYTITLIGSTVDVVWEVISKQIGKAVGLVVIVLAVLVYTSNTIIRRHDTDFVLGPEVYIVPLIFMGLAVYLCYKCRF